MKNILYLSFFLFCGIAHAQAAAICTGKYCVFPQFYTIVYQAGMVCPGSKINGVSQTGGWTLVDVSSIAPPNALKIYVQVNSARAGSDQWGNGDITTNFRLPSQATNIYSQIQRGGSGVAPNRWNPPAWDHGGETLIFPGTAFLFCMGGNTLANGADITLLLQGYELP